MDLKDQVQFLTAKNEEINENNKDMNSKENQAKIKKYTKIWIDTFKFSEKKDEIKGWNKLFYSIFKIYFKYCTSYQHIIFEKNIEKIKPNNFLGFCCTIPQDKNQEFIDLANKTQKEKKKH